MKWFDVQSESETTKSGRKVHHTKSAVRRRRASTRKRWMTNLKKAGLAAVGAHALYKAHHAGVNAQHYSKGGPPVMKGLTYGLGAAFSLPAYPASRVAAALYNSNEKIYENQSRLYKLVHAPIGKYREMTNNVLRHINY